MHAEVKIRVTQYFQCLFTAVFTFLIFSPATLADFGPDELKKLIEGSNPPLTSADEVFAALPESIRKNWSLVFDTRNRAQTATKEKPRMILFSNDGRMLMTFAGDGKVEKGGNTIEVMYQKASGEYSMSSVTFNDKKPIFNLDTKTCLECHGKPPRPIWDGYPIWNGVYGSDHHRLRNQIYGTDGAHQPTVDFVKKMDAEFTSTSSELKDFEEFKKGITGTRYEHLIGIQNANYGDAANNNRFLSNVVAENRFREVVGKLMRNKEATAQLIEMLKIYGNGDYPPVEERIKKFPPKIQAEYNRLIATKYSKNGELVNALKYWVDRAKKLNPNFYVSGNSVISGELAPRAAINVKIGMDALLEAIGNVTGATTPEWWNLNIQNSNLAEESLKHRMPITTMGGGHVYADAMNVIIEEFAARDPEFAKTVVTELADGGYRNVKINRPYYYAGMELEKRVDAIVAVRDLQYKQQVNPYPVGHRNLAPTKPAVTATRANPPACKGFFSMFLGH